MGYTSDCTLRMNQNRIKDCIICNFSEISRKVFSFCCIINTTGLYEEKKITDYELNTAKGIN